VYWFLVRPTTNGTRLILEHDGNVLLVQLGYAGKFWTFPGGGVRRGETFKESAIREAREEVGITINDPILFLEYTNGYDYRCDTVQYFAAAVAHNNVLIDGFEVIDARWVSPKDTTLQLKPSVQWILSKYNEYKQGLRNPLL
jgi:8-oxo-dGTP pyrophosphatase MutT (NUDIX family)